MLASPLRIGTRQRVAGGWLSRKLQPRGHDRIDVNDPDAATDANTLKLEVRSRPGGDCHEDDPTSQLDVRGTITNS